jgi:antitoxin (DNA-binding transcriptional repressor) of toxin-antitoxin stability system
MSAEYSIEYMKQHWAKVMREVQEGNEVTVVRLNKHGKLKAKIAVIIPYTEKDEIIEAP